MSQPSRNRNWIVRAKIWLRWNRGLYEKYEGCFSRPELLDVSTSQEVMSTRLPIMPINEDMMNDLILANRRDQLAEAEVPGPGQRLLSHHEARI